MDKKKQIQFNLNNFLLATSQAFDYVENDIYKTSLGHSVRVAYITIKLAQEFNYSHEGLNDICAYSLLHSISLSQTKEKNQEYCNLANEYANKLPFLGEQSDILKYQCELYDGSGPFSLKEDEIPLFSQFISFASLLDTKFDLASCSIDKRVEVLEYIQSNENVLFSTDMVECFTEFAQKPSFWLDLQNENELLSSIFSTLHDYTKVLDFEELLKITSIITEITNGDLEILENTSKMAKFYNFEHKDKLTFTIASSMANIGKLTIPSEILQKSSSLDEKELELIKAYPYYTKKILSNILGFSDITTWASRIQEKPEGDGYPYSLEGKDLSFKDRVLALVNAFTALTSKKEYREAYTKEEAIKILKDEARFELFIIKDLEKALV